MSIQEYSCFSNTTSSTPMDCTPRTVACQASLSMGFPRQEYWSGLPFPASGNLLDPGIEPESRKAEQNYQQAFPSGEGGARSVTDEEIGVCTAEKTRG